MGSLGALSVDLDSLTHYCRIQGLPESILSDASRTMIADKAIPRFMELLDEVGSSATFFVVGTDLSEPALIDALRGASAHGVELASHSFHHNYRLSRLDAKSIADDLEQCDRSMQSHFGSAPVGFRAPGYTLSPALAAAIAKRGYKYDSSVFPAAPYYLAKATVMAALQLVGRPSRAILDTPSVMAAPRSAYVPSVENPYRRGDAPFLELPISVSRFGRIPLFGTLVTIAPWPVVEALCGMMKHERFINFEMHAIDVLDVSDGIPPQLARQQRDLAIPFREKRRRLKKVFSWLREEREIVTLAEAACRLRPMV